MAFLLGLYLGQRERAPASLQAAVEPGARAAPAATPRLIPAVPGAERDARAVWPQALARLDDLTRRGESTAAAALAGRLLDEVLTLARSGDSAAARSQFDAYLARHPFDGAAHLLDSDLWQMQGRQDDALGPLLTLLEFADEPALIRQARDRLALLVNVRETELANRADVPGLIRYFEDLSRRDPGFDGHRLRLAHWQLRAGRLDEAALTLAETGSVGVDPRTREDLAAALVLARTGLPLEAQPGSAGPASALHVRAMAQGAPLRLLVDTGATTTALSRARADALGAKPSGRWVKVRTAGGVVDAELLRLRDVEIGALRIDSLEVLVLDEALPDGVDGLLGMDVLGRFPAPTRGAVPGLPR
ncbi:MAG: retropepsin-like aspartic protease [Pseudomonadales bacterium]